MKAIILAGGFGTRLQSVVNDVPKPMAPINNEPFLNYIFDYLKHYQIKHVVLSTGYLSEKITESVSPFEIDSNVCLAVLGFIDIIHYI